MTRVQEWSEKDTARFHFRILEKELDRRYRPAKWYPINAGSVSYDEQEAIERVERLNRDYARVGRQFKLQKRAVGEWEDVE